MKVQLKSNMSGRLNKIRAGVVYQNITSVLGELGQNSQRAGATEVIIKLEGNKLVFRDNGSGCDDPQTVFELDYSGFGVGFGEGFSSVFTIADKLNVASNGWIAEANVLDILATNNFDIAIRKSSEVPQGFAVRIEGERITENFWELDQFIKEMGAMLPMKVEYNGEVIVKKDLLNENIGSSDFVFPVDNSFYTANLSPSIWTDSKLYFESRFVCDHWVRGACANIILKPGGVTLKAPDRRGIVTDKKYHEFHEQLSKDLRAMYLEFIKDATDREISDYSEEIDRHLQPEEYMGFLKLDSSFISALQVTGLDDGMDEEALSLMLGITEVEATPEANEGVFIFERDEEDASAVTDIAFRPTKFRGTKASRNTRKDNSDVLARLKDGRNIHKVLWVSSNDYESHRTEVEQYEYYGFAIVIAHNKLYENVYKALGIQAFMDSEKDVRKENRFENVGVKTKGETRFMWLLERLERKYDLPGIFRLANISCTVEHLRNGIVVETEDLGVHGVAQHSPEGTKIYLNRESMGLQAYKVSNWESTNISVNDLRALLRNVETIAHELAHIVGGIEATDGSQLHDGLTSQIQREIADLF